MMGELQKYRKISLDFRRNSSNMLNTKYDDGLLYLIRFKEFIDRNDYGLIYRKNLMRNSYWKTVIRDGAISIFP